MEEKTKYRPISIIITAYKASAFIEDCLDSIEAQTYFSDNNKYEILLGIDGCHETLQKVKIIGHKYRNLRVFMMAENAGTYVTSNTLLDIAQYQNIIRFDSDDIMLPEMVEEILQHSEEYDLIQYGFNTFTTRKEEAKEAHYWPACGSVFYKKSFIDAAGGYRDWKCSADLELLKRTQNYPHKRHKIEKRLFLLRNHLNSLGNSEYTKLRGHYRKGVESKIRILPADQDPKIEKRVSDYKEVDFNLRDLKEILSTESSQIIKRESIRSNFGISIIITAWKTANYIEQCLNSIESQSYFTNNNNYEILLGIDGCQETLAKVKEIQEKYRNLRAFMMEENVGTYVTTNTLLDLVSYDNIIRFDSDDYMLPHMISEVMAASEEYDFIRFHFDDFDEVRKEMRPRAFLAMGAVYYKKWVIEKAGGYRDWKCNADLELLKRISNSDIRFGEIKKPLFVRRIHPNSLSERAETGIRSFFRKNLTNRVRIYDKEEEIKIERVVGKYREIIGEKSLMCIISRDNENPYESVKKMILEKFSNKKEYNNSIIILGYNQGKKISEYKEKFPGKKIIIYQLEQLASSDSMWYNKSSKNALIKKRTNYISDQLNQCDEIWDYDLENVKFLENEGFKNTKHIPMEYAESLKRENTVTNPDFDILFYGDLNQRRAIILNKLFNKYKVCIISSDSAKKRFSNFSFSSKIISPCYGDNLFKYIFNSKIIINLHFYESNIQEQVRIFELLINNKIVVSEKSSRNYFGNLIEEFRTEEEMFFIIDRILNSKLWKNTNIQDRFKNSQFEIPKKKIVVYTCITGKYDILNEVKFPKKNIDYICFSDDIISSKTWKIKKIPDYLKYLDNSRISRYIKIMPHNFLGEYDISVWVDANIGIVGDLETLIDSHLNNKIIYTAKHPARDCIYAEAIKVINSGKDSKEIVEDQMKYYRDQGYPSKNGLVQTGILIRSHNEELCKKFSEEWKNQVLSYSKRDQLSFNYVLWKIPIDIGFFSPLIISSKYFCYYRRDTNIPVKFNKSYDQTKNMMNSNPIKIIEIS